MQLTRWHGVGWMVLASLLVASSVISAQPSTGRITVVCDHDEVASNGERSSNGGLSIFVKFQGKTILFSGDGGACPLMKHLDELGVDATSIDAIVISRNSVDHIRAVADVLKSAASQPKVYVPAPVPDDIHQQFPQADIAAVSTPVEILPDAWLLGQLQRKLEGRKTTEQVLVFHQPDGLVVNVGCSYSGVASVVERVRKTFGYQKIKILTGGIHLRGTSKKDIREISLRLQQLGIQSLALSRCTGERALKIFRDEWGDRLVAFDFGDTVVF